MWITAQDASGNQISSLSTPSDVRLEIPQTQWRDIDDIYASNGKIDVPIYDFNYETRKWEEEQTGFLVDENGSLIPEEDEDNINAGTYPGRIFAAFTVDYYSFRNVDIPYVYIWTLDRVPSNLHNNSAFYDALRLAECIAKSQKGKNAFAKVNKPNKTLEDDYLNDGRPDASKKAPEINVRSMEWNTPLEGVDGRMTTLGEYWGGVSG